MITDKETNFAYISYLLEKQAPIAFEQLKYWFEKLGIKYSTLQDTKDLWVVDFMPLQIQKDNYLQYKYDPDYLKVKKYRKTKTDQNIVCEEIGIVPSRVSIILDGGNIVKCKSKVILTTKVFKENSIFPEYDLITEIKNQLQVEQVIIIPQEPHDFVGHSDGMVRFVDEDTVLVNQYPKDKKYEDFAYSLRWSLRNAGLYCIEFPYTSWQNEDESDASGCYINFLEIGNYIFYPVFDNHHDQMALIQLQHVFKDRQIIDIDCRDLAKFGGVLNCATWNILKE